MRQIGILIALMTGLSLSSPASQNLIVNGDFEQVQRAGTPVGWRSATESESAQAVYVDGPASIGNVYAGRRALSLSGGVSSADQWFVANDQLPAVQPGESYRLSARIKAKFFGEGSALRLSVVFLNEELRGKGLPQAPERVLSGSRDWQTATLDFTVPPGVSLIRPSFSMLCVSGEPGDARALLDNMELYRKAAASAESSMPALDTLSLKNLSVFSAADSRDLLPKWKGFQEWEPSYPTVSLVPEGQALHVSGEWSGEEPLRICPRRPIRLPEETGRIFTWLARQSGAFKLRYVIVDANGEEHLVNGLCSYPYMGSTYGDHSGREQSALWSAWEQHYSMNFLLPDEKEIRRRVVPEKWDDAFSRLWKKPLSLAGLEIIPTGDAPEKKLSFHLAALSLLMKPERDCRYAWFNTSRRRVGWDEPAVVFPDDFRDASESFRYRIDIRKGLQGQTVWVQDGLWAQCSRKDPLRLMANAVVLPELPAGFYSILLKNWTESELQGESRMAFYVSQSSVDSMPSAESPFSIQSGMPDHVFPSGSDTATLTVELNLPVQDGQKVHVLVQDWRGDEVFNECFSAAARIPIRFPVDSADYYAVATLLDGEQIADRARLHLGVASGETADGPFVPPAKEEQDGDLQLTAEYSRPQLSERFFEYPSTPWTPPHELFKYDRWLKEQVADRGFEEVSSLMPWADIEVLPGVFRWQEGDRRNAVAAANGVQIKAFLGVLGKWPPWTPDWWAGDLCLTQFGRPDRVGENAISSRNPWPCNYDDEGRYIFLPWLAASVKHVRDNPMVSSYKLMFPSPGWIGLPEGAAECTATDYAPASQRVFEDWLQQNGKEPRPMPGHLILPQEPMQELGPDLSEEWRDMCQFVQETSTNRLAEILQTLRALDPERPVSIYRGKFPVFEAALPMLKKANACFFDESGPNFFSRALASMSAQAGVRYANENHFYMPSSREIVDADIFYGTIYNKGWSYSYRWHERHKRDDTRFFDALDNVIENLPMIGKYAEARSSDPQVLVFGSRADQMFNHQQAAFFAAISGIDLFTGLFSYFQILPHFANEYTDWVTLEKFKVVFVCGDVMTQKAIDRITQYARQGGHVVVVGDAGRYCVETPEERNCLRRALKDAQYVFTLPKPGTEAPAPGMAPLAPYSADAEVMTRALSWAGVEREIMAVDFAGKLDSRFEGMVRHIDDESFFASVFRRAPEFEGGPFNRWYNALMLTERSRELWGAESVRLKINVPADGRYKITRLHREAEDLGAVTAVNGIIKLNVQPMGLGELKLFRLERLPDN